MPIKKAEIDKTKRLNTVLDVVKKWGALDKKSIDLHVATRLGVSTQDVSRAVYRDLDYLVNNRDLEVVNYTRDGAMIDNFDPDIHKNFQNKWRPLTEKNDFLGGSLLSSIGVSIYVSRRLNNGVVLEPGAVGIRPSSIQLFFSVGKEFIGMTIDQEILPFKIIIGRGKEILHKVFPEIENEIGKRLIYISVPDASISAYDSKSKLGHAMIDFTEDQILVTDFGSKNGTSITKLRNDEISIAIESGGQYGKSTVSTKWYKKAIKSKPDIFLKKNALGLPRPFILSLSEDSSFLIV